MAELYSPAFASYRHGIMRTPSASCLLACLVLGVAQHAAAEPLELAFPPHPPVETLELRLGMSDLRFTYARPATGGETELFGGLVPFGERWLMGGALPAAFETSTTVYLNGIQLLAGTYTVSIVPEVHDWMLIFNNEPGVERVSAFNPKFDAAEVPAIPTEAPTHTENFTLHLDHLHSNGATLTVNWGTVTAPISLRVPADLRLKRELAPVEAGEATLTPEGYHAAARYYYEQRRALETALTWIDHALEAPEARIEKLILKARILEALERPEAALEAAQAAHDTAEQVGVDALQHLWHTQKLLQHLQPQQTPTDND